MADINLSAAEIGVRDLVERSDGFQKSLAATKQQFTDLRNAIAATNTKHAALLTQLAGYNGTDRAWLTLKARAAIMQAELSDVDAKAGAAQTWSINNA